MRTAEQLVMVVVTAYQDRLAFLAICAALLAAAITVRLSPGRRWYDSATTFLILTTLLTALAYLTTHVLLDLPIAGIEVVSFRG